MPYSLKEHVAECYRRAEDYGRLCQGASNSKERETLWFTSQHFLLLAKVLERKLGKLQAAARTERQEAHWTERGEAPRTERQDAHRTER
jgi:hypothetical protein